MDTESLTRDVTPMVVTGETEAIHQLVIQRLENFGFQHLEQTLAHPIIPDQPESPPHPPVTEPTETTSQPAVAGRSAHVLGVAQQYLRHHMERWVQPIKFYHLTHSADRVELHVEVVGDDSPLVDAMTIVALWQMLQGTSLAQGTVVQLNSVGDQPSQALARRALSEYYHSLRTHLCSSCQTALLQNPLLLLSCQEQPCQVYKSAGPQPIDFLQEQSRSHLMLLLEYLDSAGVPYDLNPFLIHDDPYASETVIAIQRAASPVLVLATGGRYDNVISQLDGPVTPAFGLTIDLGALAKHVGQRSTLTPVHRRPQLLIIQLGARARKKAVPLLVHLSTHGLGVSMALGKESLRGQLKSAATMGTALALIIGEREALDDTVIVRTMHDNTQETYPLDEVETVIEGKLAELNES